MGIETVLVVGLAVVSLITSLVLGQQAKDAAASMSDADATTLGDINQPQMTEGVVIPVVFGYGLISGNLIWWDAFKQNLEHAEYYKYKMWLVYCMGQIDTQDFSNGNSDGIRTFWLDGKPAVYSILYSYELLTAMGDTRDRWVEMPDNVIYRGGDDNKKPGISFFNEPYATRLQGIANLLIGARLNELGGFLNNPASLEQGVTNLPDIRQFVKRVPISPLVKIQTADGVNPASTIYEMLVDTQWGGAIPTTTINEDSFNAASIYFDDHKLYMNYILAGTRSIKDSILKIQEWTDTFLVKDINDQYSIKLLLDTDAENPAATVYDDDIIDFSLRRKSWEETFNAFTGNFKPIERIPEFFTRPDQTFGNYGLGRNDNTRTATIKNEANIALTGSVRSKVVDLTCYSRVDSVSYRLNQIMKKESFPYATASLKVNLKFLFLRAGDVIVLDLDEYSINAPFRITSVNYDKLASNEISFELLQMRELLIDPYIESTSDLRGTYSTTSIPICLENLTFPAFTSLSTKLSYTFLNDADSIVHFSTGQLMSGRLEYGLDYTVVNHNRIQLDETIYANEILFNESGNMNIDVYEKDCPQRES